MLILQDQIYTKRNNLLQKKIKKQIYTFLK